MAGTREPDGHLPQPLIDELRRLDRAPDVITARVDRTVAATAREHFSVRGAPRWRRHGAWGAMAACAVLAVALAIGRQALDGEPALYSDVDGSGRIDIADVLALARSGSGVDEADLDAFAWRVVALNGAEAQ